MANAQRDRTSPAKAGALNKRKLAHLDACLDERVDLGRDSFDRYKLLYNALPEIALEEVSCRAEFAGKAIAAPIIISSMTGGVGDRITRINRNLAAGAERLGLPLGLGSTKVALADDRARDSFQVREVAPTIPLIANLGLVSFNYTTRYEDLQRIREWMHPDVFALHLNALQEAIQVGGDTNFRGLWKHLEEIVRLCPLPVYVKECGGGIAPALVARLATLGVSYVDISGSDGTSWAAVEGRVGGREDLGELFKDFGIPTAWILERLPAELDRNRRAAKIVAGGGIRNGLQAAKALALGADYVSLARPFLIAAEHSVQAVVEAGERLIHELRLAMFLVGATRVDQLRRELLIEPN